MSARIRRAPWPSAARTKGIIDLAGVSIRGRAPFGWVPRSKSDKGEREASAGSRRHINCMQAEYASAVRRALWPILLFLACVDPRAAPLLRDGGGDDAELPADGPAPAVVPDAPAARPPDAPQADLAAVTPAPDASGTGGSGGSGGSGGGSPDAGCKAGQH